MAKARYDDIGRAYALHRRPDPRIADRINRALGDARRVVNVGAGTGSYEPDDRAVVAVEPSAVMIAQRAHGSAPVVRARAEALPFRSASFDAALAILTLHHWTDQARGLAEFRRVASRCVVLCFDNDVAHDYWAIRDYWPAIEEMDRPASPPVTMVADALGTDHVETVAIPWDCQDGFLGAYWRRPEAYFQPDVRAGISGLARLEPEVLEQGLRRLRRDLDDGTWSRNQADLLDRHEIDLGYRLVIAQLR